MPERSVANSSPFVGVAPFAEADQHRFFGREREINELECLVVANPVMLLYAPSGAGKTSLVNAGLIPALKRDEACEVLPPARVSGPLPKVQAVGGARNRFVLHALSCWLGATAPQQGLELLGEMSLRDFLDRLAPEAGLEVPPLRVLIFDQFEEMFAENDLTQCEERRGFFAQVAEALQANRLLRIVFCLREEYLARMEPYIRSLAGHPVKSHRLERLHEQAARKALTGPLKLAGYELPGGAASKLVKSLLAVRYVARDGTERRAESEYIEPVQIGVVSEFLWQKLTEERTKALTEDLPAGFGDVDQALSEFYERCLREVRGRHSNIDEPALRRLFHFGLITENGTRGMYLKGERETAGLPNEALELLEDLHILRTEWRANAAWYELAHDRFISPVRVANLKWYREEVEPGQLETIEWLEREASAWERNSRGKSRLLTAGDLKRAEALLLSPAAHRFGLTELAREYIQSSKSAHLEHELARLHEAISLKNLRAARARRAWAYSEVQRLRQEIRTAEALGNQGASETLAAQMQAKRQELDRAERGLKSAIEKLPAHIRERSRAVHGTGGMRRLRAHQAQVFGVAFSRAGLLASASADGTAALWDITSGSVIRVLRGHSDTVVDATFSPDGAWLATASHDGRAKLWDVATGAEIRSLKGHRNRVWDVDFSPDGLFLATASEDGAARIWHLQDGTSRELKAARCVFGVAFSADSSLLATTGDDWLVRVWSVQSGQVESELSEHTNWSWSVAFSPVDRCLASGGFDGKVVLRELGNGGKVLSPGCQPGSQLGVVAFSPDARLVAVGCSDGTVAVWEAASGSKLRDLHGDGPVYGIAFSPDSRHIAAGCQDNSVLVFPLS